MNDLPKITKDEDKGFKLMMLQVENEGNKYDLEHEKEKKIMEKNFDSISVHEYFKSEKQILL